MILGGIDLKTVQMIMGHANAETTMRVYANVTKAQADVYKRQLYCRNTSIKLLCSHKINS